MEDYKLIIQDDETIVELKQSGFKMRVFKANANFLKGDLALLEATLYVEDKSFIPVSNYLFEALNYESIEQIDIGVFKAAVAFYFNSTLGLTYL